MHRYYLKSPLIPLLPVYDRKRIAKGEVFLLPLVSDPEGKGRWGGIL